MKILVFLGPTLEAWEAREILTADYLPPVQQGDIYRALAVQKVDAIAIIDGIFEERAAVWHKEVLWALSQGVAVYGAASMGALRAAELDVFAKNPSTAFSQELDVGMKWKVQRGWRSNQARRQRLSRWLQATRRRFGTFGHLEVEILNREFEHFRDKFDARICEELIYRAAAQTDHAARLAMLWAALRQLCAVPYTDAPSTSDMIMWDKFLSEWIRSAGWYGLHNGSPFSLLAAVNSLDSIRASAARKAMADQRGSPLPGAHSARASALYSMSKRTLLPWHRRELLWQALREVEQALLEEPEDPSGKLAVRGSIYGRLWNLRQAARDHERAVELRRARKAIDRQLGEALTELGWTYTRALRFRDSRRVFAEGVVLLQSSDPANEQDANFVMRGLFKYAIFMALTLDFGAAANAMRKACRLASELLARDQVRGMRRFLCRLINRTP